MPRHSATDRVVKQSLYEIDNEISPTKKRQRSNPRYTSVSARSSNVTPMSRKTTRSKTVSRSKVNKIASQSADVIHLNEVRSRAHSAKQAAKNLRGEYESIKKQLLHPNRRGKSSMQHSVKRADDQVKNVVWYPKRRARVVAIILLLPFVLIVGKLVEVQIIHSKKYSALGVAQRRLIREISPDRGTITDRNGNVLAISEPAYSVVADPSLIKNDDALLRKLHKLTVFDDEDVEPLLKNRKSRYALVARHVDEATAKRVQRQKLPGISIVKDPKREYPSRDVAANVVGFVGADMNGLGGIEYMLDSKLAGQKGKEVIERDPKGREIPSAQRDVQGAIRGSDVSLTLDEGIQYEAQRVVLEEVLATGSKGGTAIIADVKTGEILAMVSVVGGPSNPVIAPPTDSNHAVTDVYEPGSTNKVITVSGALEDKVISTGSTLNVPDTITYDNKDFVDHDPHETMTWTAKDILRESSNVGTIMIANKLHKKRLDHYLRAYGFGSKTALNFPGEASGILLDPKDWSDTSIATVPIGNGLAVTPMQMLSVYMTIANNGLKAEPHLIKSSIDENGKRKEYIPKKAKRIISLATAKTMHSMLQEAVESGTGKKAVVSGYSVAGKTGTARKPPYDKPPYKYMASFAGFAPANNPRVASIVILDEPKGDVYGGSVAAPVFSRIMQTALRVMAVEPDQAVQGQSITNEPTVTTTTSTTTPALVP